MKYTPGTLYINPKNKKIFDGKELKYKKEPKKERVKMPTLEKHVFAFCGEVGNELIRLAELQFLLLKNFSDAKEIGIIEERLAYFKNLIDEDKIPYEYWDIMTEIKKASLIDDMRAIAGQIENRQLKEFFMCPLTYKNLSLSANDNLERYRKKMRELVADLRKISRTGAEVVKIRDLHITAEKILFRFQQANKTFFWSYKDTGKMRLSRSGGWGGRLW